MKNICLLFVLLLVGCAQEKGSEKRQAIIEPEAIQTEEARTVAEPEDECKTCVESIYAGTEPDTAFKFSGGQRLLLCGYSEAQGNKKIYSEFVLSECGNKTLLGFWGALEKHEVTFVQDTLKLSKLVLLAVGKNQELEEKTWLTESFYYNDNKLQRVKNINPKIKYSSAQINKTLQEYEATVWRTQIGASEEYTEDKMRLANRLLIASVSGNSKAEQYFLEFPSKFKPDGAYSEWYREMENMLHFYKTQESLLPKP